MGKNLEINIALEKYIEELSYNLHPIQQEIINIMKILVTLKECKFQFLNVTFYI